MTEARLRAGLARLIMPGWRGRGRLPRLPFGGILILRHGDLRETARFIRRLPPGILVAADVECGLAMRFPGAVPHPGAMAVGATGDPRVAFRQGRAIGLACRRLGVRLAFAPVVDVNSNPANPIINTRAFGGDPHRVARMGAAWIRGCQSAGVLACAKHFPGHGDTRADSHSRLPVVRASSRLAWRRELPPFRAAVRAGVAAVMTAHVAFPALGAAGPATLSTALVTGVLRRRLGFRGLVLTDGLRMGGIARGFGEGEAGVLALKAGCDVLLDPEDPEGLLEHLLGALRKGELPRGTVEAAVRRVAEAARRVRVLPPPPAAAVAAAERAVRRAVARRAVTRLGSLAAPLPGKALRREPSLWIVLDDGAARGVIAAFRRAVRRRFPRARFSGKGPFPWAVLAVFARVRMDKGRIAPPRALLAGARRAAGRARRVAVLLCGSPYVARELPRRWPVLAVYGEAPDSLEAGLEALEERLPARGRLPVAL